MKTSPRMQQTVTAIAAKHGLDLKLRGAYLRLTMPHFDPLVVEVLHENVINVAHVYQPQPETVIGDPAIAFFTGDGRWLTIEITQRIGGYRIYAVLADGWDDILSISSAQQAMLANFAEMWADEIVAQGWLNEGVLDDSALCAK